ncbi:MAG: DUF2062 domain-containing protein [Deltaproteobacteria bacterium]|uniref:DUF2062 domain-containing protein n=1 Tax=Candidatus Zymogenus saltonus TaxID=2844893 RepID=A0A9D8KDI7_9DELT|nr:DUF2062 domain-containing protein [Candidatus Zymogenus saltonus]
MERKNEAEVGGKEVVMGEAEVEEKDESKKKKKRRSFKDLLKRAVKSDDTPGQIALGMGIGVLMAFSPLAGTQTIFALGLSFILRANKLSALAGTFFANPFTMPVFYFYELKLGKAILGYSLEMPDNVVNDFNGLMSLGSEVMLSLVVGFLMVGTITAVIAYFVTLRSVFALRKIKSGGEKSDI